MPTLLIWQGHRFRFYSSDGLEPPHVHIVKGKKSTKIWLRNLDVAYNRGYSEAEIKKLLRRVNENQTQWIENWNEFFGV